MKQPEIEETVRASAEYRLAMARVRLWSRQTLAAAARGEGLPPEDCASLLEGLDLTTAHLDREVARYRRMYEHSANSAAFGLLLALLAVAVGLIL